MNRIDIKSAVIGALCVVIIILLLGTTQQDVNYGDIAVTSLKLVNEDNVVVAWLGVTEHGGLLRIGNNYGVPVVDLEANEDGGGVGFATNRGATISYLGAEEEGGTMGIFTNSGILGVHMAALEIGSLIDIKGKNGKSIITLSPDAHGDGSIILYDTHGNIR